MTSATSPAPTPPLTPGYELGSPGYRRVTLSLFMAGFVTFALLYATQPLLPALAAEFGLTPATSALSVSFATIGLGVALLVAGPLSEVRGRTPLMLASLFASSVIGIACGLVPSWPLMLALRGLEGVLLSGLPAVAMAYLSEEMAAGAQARAAGVYVGGTALGGMSARLLNALLTDIFGWRVALSGIGFAALLATIAVFLLLPRSHNFRPAPATVGHLLQSTRSILTDRGLIALFAIGGASMGAFVGIFNTIGFRLQGEPYHLGIGIAGLVYLVYSLGSYASARAGHEVARHGQRAVAPWCAVLLLGGVLLTLATPLVLVVAGLAVISAGFFALHGVASGWVAARATLGSGAPGQASSGYLVTYYAGSSLFGSLAGAAYSAGAWPAVVGMCGALVLLALGLTLVMRRIPSLLETSHPDPGMTAY